MSSGLALACGDQNIDVELTAINHWTRAIETHQRNHPWARHICASAETLDPREVVPGGRLDLMVAAPECRFFSVARGGRPVEDQKRASAWQILRWLELLEVESLLVENVREFADWCPVGRNGLPLKSRKGETYRAWIEAIRSLGYTVEWRVMNAADHGDATSRRRLFVMARRGRRPITWPKPTHSKNGEASGTKRWRAAREIIDWSLEGESIFSRKKPLAEATMRRIIAGLERFGGPELQPFLVILRGTGGARSVDDPAPTVTGGGNHLGLVEPEPFVMHLTHGGRERSVDDPLPTVTGANRGELGVVQPFILSQASGGAPRETGQPVPTIPAGGAHALVQPFILPPLGYHHRGGKANRPRSPDEPLQTITRRGGGYLVEPLIVPFDQRGGGDDLARPVSDPLGTITTKARHGVAEAFIVPYFGERDGQSPRVHSVDAPLPAPTSHGAGAVVEPYLVEYYSNGSGLTGHSINQPVPTITARDRIGLVRPVVNGRTLDIRFRMLQPHELSAAMGFDSGYAFTGTKQEIVRQIGNAVAVHMSRALCRSLLRAV